jgi:hypothetical protein
MFSIVRVPAKLIPQIKNSLLQSLADNDNVEQQLKQAISSAENSEVVLHIIVRSFNKEVCGLVTLNLWAIDGEPFLNLHFIAVRDIYRGKRLQIQSGKSKQKLSHYILDYSVSILHNINRYARLEKMFLQPVNNKVAQVYKEFGFTKIDESFMAYYIV